MIVFVGVHQVDAPVQVSGEDAGRRDEEDIRLPQGILGGILSIVRFINCLIPCGFVRSASIAAGQSRKTAIPTKGKRQ